MNGVQIYDDTRQAKAAARSFMATPTGRLLERAGFRLKLESRRWHLRHARESGFGLERYSDGTWSAWFIVLGVESMGLSINRKTPQAALRELRRNAARAIWSLDVLRSAVRVVERG